MRLKKEEKVMSLSKIYRSQITKARTVGGVPSIYLPTSELAMILSIVCSDLHLDAPECIEYNDSEYSDTSFYDIPITRIKYSV